MSACIPVIEDTFKAYENIVFMAAREKFNDRIKPFLEENHLNFLSGNGGFCITWTEKTPKRFVDKYGDNRYGNFIDPDKLPENIQKYLFYEIPGFSANNLGSLMPDYSCEE